MTSIPPPLSADGKIELEKATKQFIDDVTFEAGTIAKAKYANEATAKHVELATDVVYRRGRSPIGQLSTSFGGLIAGIGGSGVATSLTANQINGVVTGLWIFAMVFGLVIMQNGLSRYR